MRKTLLAGAAAVTMILAPLAISQSSFTRVAAVGESGAMTYDSRRGVLTMAPLLEQTTPAVVNIATSGKARLPRGFQGNEDLFERFFGQQAPQQERNRSSVGSGVIVNSGNGYIMTNHHVVDGADEIYVTLKDRRTLEAEIVGSDPKTDIAVLKVDARNLKALKFADSDEVYVGDYVIAIGNPFGLGQTVTSGIISALGRAGGSSDKYEDFIQTDASINPGNSGGALINSKGELIGINTAIVSRSGGNNGIGFAVPSKMAKGVMSQLVSYGEVRRGRIGVAIQNISPDLMDAMDLSTSDGALVSSVTEGSPADKAGLKEGDIIVGFNGEDIFTSSDIRNEVGLVEHGTRTDITYVRDGKRRSTRILVEEFEEDRDVLDDKAAEDIPSFEKFDGAEITNIPEDLNARGGDEGVYVANVRRGSKAFRAGLAKGDIIREVNRTEITDLNDFEDAIDNKSGAMALTVERNGSNIFIAVR